MGNSDRTGRRPATELEQAETEAERLPSPPAVSRVDTLPEDFVATISRRPHLVGDIIASRYKLLDLLGDGAMGQVFVAENLAIRRRVAIKVLKPEVLADALFRQRFQLEAEAISAIDQRNVVRFLDLVVGDPTFLVMEYVRGPTLAQVLRKERKLSSRRAVHLATRLCWALDASHRLGVIHRDVKPSNIILAADAESGEEPKLIDFGLAKYAAIAPEDQLTRSGQIVGTPHYMSPEQIANREVDARSDVYALGCVLYHVVAGSPPFDGDTDVNLLYQHLQAPLRPVRERAPEVSAELAQLIERALAKDPNLRFQTMPEMARALDGIAAPAAPSGAKLAPQPTALGWLRRPALFFPLAVLAILAAGGIAYWLAHPPAAKSHELIFVSSTPPGASIEVDGRRLGRRTPAAIDGIGSGRHVVRVSSENHDTVERVVTLAPAEEMGIEVVLPAKNRQLEIQTVPSGALVYIDGRLQSGQTPVAITVSDDDFHEIHLEKAGFAPLIRSLQPEGREKRLTFSLQPELAPFGAVWVDSNVISEVLVDTTSTGLTTPTLALRVSTGEHVISLRGTDGTEGPKKKVVIRRGDNLHITLDWDSH